MSLSEDSGSALSMAFSPLAIAMAGMPWEPPSVPVMWLEAALLYGTPCRFHDTNPQHASSAVCATMLAVARAVNSAIACQMNVLF